MALLDRLLKATSLENTGVLSESEIYNTRDFAPTEIPMLNVAFSADPFGGVSAGLTTIAGPSRHFKTLFCLIGAKAYMDKYADAIMIFYDSEFGSPPSYFKSVGIDTNRVVHVPITTYEDLIFDSSKKFDEIKAGDHVIVVVDSLGNLASKKEAEDAKKENSAADMTRAKVNKSYFRIVTPHLRLKGIPMFVVQHTYNTMEMYSKKIVSGGQGTMLASDTVLIIGRQQDKDGKDLQGYDFVINVEKSRYVKEKSKIPITVSFKGGIRRWSGILDLAVEAGLIVKVTAQSYCRTDPATGEVLEDVKYKRKDIEYNSELFKQLFAETNLAEFITKKYAVSYGSLIVDELNETDEQELDSILEAE